MEKSRYGVERGDYTVEWIGGNGGWRRKSRNSSKAVKFKSSHPSVFISLVYSLSLSTVSLLIFSWNLVKCYTLHSPLSKLAEKGKS